MSDTNNAAKLREIYLHAIDIDDGAARASYLNEACGASSPLRRQVEKMLTFQQEDSPLAIQQAAIEEPAVVGSEEVHMGATNLSSPDAMGIETTDDIPKRGLIDVSSHPTIGNYKLLEELGQGGMGTVYMAQQTQPVKRKVALKIIKAGMDTKEVIARFEAERQALAMMDHPHIAKVLDGGSTDTGRPYFVMELVRGVTITDFCQAKKLGLRDRLELFIDVCQAVQHAHQKGIIHRDLKPSNVLVTMHDHLSVVKVIDFGVSKALNQELTERTLFTQFSQMVGTPLYMAPEQAQMSGLDIDTRSDVYSLGVILYELLTGTTPFDRDTISKLSIDGIRKLLQEKDPERPSFRISTIKAGNLSTIDDQRQIDTQDISKQLKRELDWIVMKALEKDRERRYESASDFAQDIRRYLDNEPVDAHPPSVAYKLKKYANRHKGLLATLTVMALTLLIATGVSVSYAFQADQAREEAEVERGKAEAEKEKAEVEKAKAVAAEENAEREAEISKAVNEFLNEDLLAQANPENQPDPNVKLRTIIDQAAQKLEDKFADQPVVEAAIRHTLAESYFGLGNYKTAKQHADRSLKLRTKHLESGDEAVIESTLLSARLLRQMGKPRECLDILKPLFLHAQASLGTEHLLTLRIGRYLGLSYLDFAEYENAEDIFDSVLKIQQRTLGPDHPETLRTKYNWVILYREKGNYTDAERLCLSILTTRQKTLGNEHPDTLLSMINLAGVFSSQDQLEKAEEWMKKALLNQQRVLSENHPHIILSMKNLAAVYVSRGKYQEAEKLLQTALEKSQHILGDEHPVTNYIYLGMAYLHEQLGDYDQAEKLAQKVLKIRQRTLGPDHPDTLIVKRSVGSFLIRQRRFDDAEKTAQECLEGFRQVFGDRHPSTIGCLHNLQSIYLRMDNLEKAEEVGLQAFELYRQTLGMEHSNTLRVLLNLAYLDGLKKRYDERERKEKQVLEIFKRTLGEDHTYTLMCMDNLGATYIHQARYADAEQIYLRALEASQRSLGKAHPRTLRVMFNLAVNYQAQSNYEKAVDIYRDIIQIGTEAWGDDQEDVVNAHEQLGITLRIQDHHDEAENIQKRTIELKQKIYGAESQEVINARDDLAITYRESDQVDDWERTVRENLELKRRVLGEEHKDTNYSYGQLRSVIMRKGQQAAEQDDWPGACEMMTPPLSEIRPHFQYYEALLPALLLANDETSYRDVCRGAWEKFHHVEKAKYQESGIVILCALSTENGIDPEQLVIVADGALALKPDNAQRQLAHALALYRAGRFAEAVQTMQNDGQNWIHPLAAFVRAMALHESGNTDNAEQEYFRAVQLMADIAPSPTEGVKLEGGPKRWVLHAMCRVLLKEAEALIGIPADTVPLQPPPPPLPQPAAL